MNVPFCGLFHAVEAVDENAFTQRITDLDSPMYLGRQKATRGLSKLDRLAEPALRKALAGKPSLELRQSIQQLLEQLEVVPSPEQLQALRAIGVLKLTSTAEARRGEQSGRGALSPNLPVLCASAA